MFSPAELTDEAVHAAASGSRDELDRVAAAFAPLIRGMVAARLAATPAQFDAVDELAQQSLTGLVTGIGRLENRTVAGLKAYLSAIVSRKVADFIAERRGGSSGPGVRSLNSSLGDISQVGPLLNCLSDSATSPLSAIARADQCNRVIHELGRLKSEHRDVITFAFFDQLSTAEIGTRLQVSRPAASMLLIRAVQALRRNLTGSSQLDALDESSP